MDSDEIAILVEGLGSRNELKSISKESFERIFAAALDLGYRISPPKKVSIAQPLCSEAAEILTLLEESPKPDLNLLLSRWNARNPELWPDSPEVYQTFGDKLLKMGVPLAACDVFSDGLSQCPDDVRLRQLMALALARSGGTRKAQTILSKLYQEGNANEETLGLLARTYKDLGLQAATPGLRKKQFEMSFHFYFKAYHVSGGYWTGINAATMAFLLSKHDQAGKIANEIKGKCLDDLTRAEASGQDSYWALATLGEVSLILGKDAEAEHFYQMAAKAGRGRYGDLSSTRRNARLLFQSIGKSGANVERCFEIPPVLVFAGWIRGGKAVNPPPLSLELETVLREKIRERLKALKFSIAYASAATSSDLLFLETIRQLNGETNIILSHQDQSLTNSETPISSEEIRLQKVLKSASQVVKISDQFIQEEKIASEYAEIFLLGMANLRAQQLETNLIPIIIREGNSDQSFSSSAPIYSWFQKLCVKAEIIYLGAGRGQKTASGSSANEKTIVNSRRRETAFPREEFTTVIRSLLFGDAVHFSKLTEKQIPIFHHEFLKPIGGMVTSSPYAPITTNTWGDGLYFVFKNVKDAGLFALDLCEWVNSIDWEKKGLPSTMNLRIALHAGPVFFCRDAITGQKTFSGTHVSRAARIEPITPIGQVYSSQAFAALSSAENAEEFLCEYVGQTPLAKGYGTFPTYLVRRRFVKS